MFRSILFWAHLCVGVATGLVILVMSVTGVLLTYERQMIASAERGMYSEPPAQGSQPLRADELLAAVGDFDPAFSATYIAYSPNQLAPAVVGAGRSGSYYVDRWGGAVLEDRTATMKAVFSTITGWHRWFDVDRDSRGPARAITGASNLLFLFLILSGLYLWLPPVFRWAGFRSRLAFNAKATSAKARDYNWHHVFGFWMAIPLAVVVASALVFSYGWANDLVYRAFGEEAPVRGRPTAAIESQSAPEPAAAGTRLPIDDIASIVASAEEGWRRLQVYLPGASDPVVRVAVDQGTGGQPQRRYDVIVDAATGSVIDRQTFSGNSPGRQARSYLRFLHTGEALGLFGQTVAGLVSALSVLMVWTGLALAWRRLVSPLLRTSLCPIIAAMHE